MKKHTKGMISLDYLLFTIAVGLLVSGVSIPLIHAVREYKHVSELDIYSDRLFLAVEQKYWSHVAETRCIVAPSIDLELLISEGFLGDNFNDNSWINPGQLTVEITTSPLHESGLPLDMRSTIEPNGFPAEKLTSTRYFAGITDSTPKVVKLAKRFDVSLNQALPMHLNSNNCEGL